MKILCPIDFSDHSIMSLRYAIKLSNLLGSELHILNAYHVPHKSDTLIKLDDRIRINTEEEMRRLLSGVSPLVHSDKLIITKVIKGHPSDVILEYAKIYEIDLIVMGTQGKNSIRTFVFGSVTKSVLKKSKVPLLAIPDEYRGPLAKDKFLFAYDGLGFNDGDQLKFLFALCEKLALKVKVLHISDDLDDLDHFQFEEPQFLEKYLGEIEFEEDDEIVDTIGDHIQDEQVSMLIMIRRQKKFMERLFNISTTAKETGKVHIPLLILCE